VVNTARMFGGALGLAVLATLATSRTNHDLSHHLTTPAQALVNGFHVGFVVAAAIGFVGALVAVFVTPGFKPAPAPQTEPAAAAAIEL
jgi:hypothetical protein